MNEISIYREKNLTGHKDSIYSIVPSPVAGQFFSAGGDGMVVAWEINEGSNGVLMAQLPNTVYAMCPMPDKNILAVGQNYEGIHLIDLTTRKEAGTLKLGNTPIYDIYYANGILFVGNGAGEVILINPDDLQILKRLKFSGDNARTIAVRDRHMAVGYSDNHIRIIDLKNLNVLHDIEAHEKSIFSLKYHGTGGNLISVARDARIKFWNTDKGYTEENTIIGHLYAINSIDFRPDYKYFATGSMDKTIKIWQSEDRKLLKVIDKARHGGHKSSVNKIFWSNYKNRLISCSDDRSISVWNIKFDKEP